MKLVTTLLWCCTLSLGGATAQGAFPGGVGVLAISSDQSAVASGDIYSIRADGTGRTDLSRNPLSEADASWSPDASHIAFSRAGLLMVMDADGSGQVMLGMGSEPAWSPDGRRLAFVRDGNLWSSAPNGAAEVRLTSAGNAHAPDWSPDGRYVAFVQQENSASFGSRLEVVGASGGDVLELARGINPGSLAFDNFVPLTRREPFAWSNDSRSLFYGSGYILYRVAVDAASVDVVLRAPASVGAMVLSPDGDRLAFTVVGGQTASNGVWVITPETGTARQLTRSGKESEQLLAWSPDSRQIAFTRANDVRIHLISADTAASRTLPREHPGSTFGALAWAADGERLLFITTFKDDTELYSGSDFLADGPGGRVRQLTRNWSQDVDPAWSPDGSQLAFASDRSGNYDIYTMRADGTRVRRLTHDPSADRQPSWSPDGSQIVFSSGRPMGARERKEKKEGDLIAHLYLISADGAHLRRLTHGTTIDQTPTWSPDGRAILYSACCASLPMLESIRPSGGRPQPTLEFGLDPDWSPKGGAVVFIQVWYPDDYDDGPWERELAIRRFDGGLGASLGDHAAARWSPDGTLLATADGSVLDRSGVVRRRIPVGQVSWQPRCTRSGNGLDNVLRGGPKPDVICGFRGNDTLIASVAGHDRLFGGAGSDRIETRNGHFDVIGCGPGTDTVVADQRDLVGVDCERVLR